MAGAPSASAPATGAAALAPFMTSAAKKMGASNPLALSTIGGLFGKKGSTQKGGTRKHAGRRVRKTQRRK